MNSDLIVRPPKGHVFQAKRNPPPSETILPVVDDARSLLLHVAVMIVWVDLARSFVYVSTYT